MLLTVHNSKINDAFENVPRHKFLPPCVQHLADIDRPISIGYRQTCSQPSLLLYMMDRLNLDHTSKVLEIGCGCGYQAALLAEVVHSVYAMEIIPQLAEIYGAVRSQKHR